MQRLGRLGYGAANLGNLFRPISDDDAWAILDAAWESGIRYFDTAPHYGLGLSERRLGAFLQTKPRDEFVVSTKAGRLLRPNPDDDGGLDLDNSFHVRTDVRREPGYTADAVRVSLHDSLERMGLDRIDLLYLHDPEYYSIDVAVNESVPGLVALRDEGLVDAVGIGSMDSSALLATVDTGALDAAMVAGRYTLLEQPAATDVLPACHRTDTGIVAASVFNSGLLAKADPDRATSRYEYGPVPDHIWDRLQRILAVCRSHDVPLPVAAVQFPFQDAATRNVVVGSSRPEQLRQNAELMNAAVPDGLWSDLRAEGLIP